jgi:Peptidase propeptide and YPEB domain
MMRPSFARRTAGLAIAASVGAGLGIGATAVWSAAGADAQPTTRSTPATGSSSTSAPSIGTPSVPPVPAMPSTPAAPTPTRSPFSHLTVGGVPALAARVAPGRVTEVTEDDDGPGLRYDVTVEQADGTSTDVEIDAATGRVLSITRDDGADGS